MTAPFMLPSTRATSAAVWSSASARSSVARSSDTNFDAVALTAIRVPAFAPTRQLGGPGDTIACQHRSGSLW